VIGAGRRMDMRPAALVVVGTVAGLSLVSPGLASAAKAAEPLPATTRALTLEQTADAYRWALERADAHDR